MKKNPIINKNTIMFFNEPEPKVQMSVCDQHIFVIHLSVYFSHTSRIIGPISTELVTKYLLDTGIC